MDPYYYYKGPRPGKPNLDSEFVLSEHNQDTTNQGPMTHSYDYSNHSTRFENFTNTGQYIATNNGAIHYYPRPLDDEHMHIRDRDRLHPTYSNSTNGEMRHSRRELEPQALSNYPEEDREYDAQPPPPYYSRGRSGHAQSKLCSPSPYGETREYHANPMSTAGSHGQSSTRSDRKHKDEAYRDEHGRLKQVPISRRLSPQPKIKPDRPVDEKDYQEMSPRSRRYLHEYVALKRQHEEEVVYVSSESDDDEKLYKKLSKVRLGEGKSVAHPRK